MLTFRAYGLDDESDPTVGAYALGANPREPRVLPDRRGRRSPTPPAERALAGVLVVDPTDNDPGGPVRRNFFALLSLLVVCAVGAAPPCPRHGRRALPGELQLPEQCGARRIQMDADPPGANNWKCRPTSRHPRPVVLVHGTAGNKNTNWQTYAPLLANNGYCVFALTYGVSAGTPKGVDQFGGLDKIETSAQQLKAFVTKVRKATGAKQGRHPRALAGHADAELLPEVPRRSAVRAQLRLARPAVARHRRGRHARQVDGRVRTQPGRPGAAGLQGLLARCRPGRRSCRRCVAGE